MHFTIQIDFEAFVNISEGQLDFGNVTKIRTENLEFNDQNFNQL